MFKMGVGMIQLKSYCPHCQKKHRWTYVDGEYIESMGETKQYRAECGCGAKFYGTFTWVESIKMEADE